MGETGIEPAPDSTTNYYSTVKLFPLLVNTIDYYSIIYYYLVMEVGFEPTLTYVKRIYNPPP